MQVSLECVPHRAAVMSHMTRHVSDIRNNISNITGQSSERHTETIGEGCVLHSKYFQCLRSRYQLALALPTPKVENQLTAVSLVGPVVAVNDEVTRPVVLVTVSVSIAIGHC